MFDGRISEKLPKREDETAANANFDSSVVSWKTLFLLALN